MEKGKISTIFDSTKLEMHTYFSEKQKYFGLVSFPYSNLVILSVLLFVLKTAAESTLYETTGSADSAINSTSEKG